MMVGLLEQGCNTARLHTMQVAANSCSSGCLPDKIVRNRLRECGDVLLASVESECAAASAIQLLVTKEVLDELWLCLPEGFAQG